MMVCFLDKTLQAEVFRHSALLWVQTTCRGQQLLSSIILTAVFAFEVYILSPTVKKGKGRTLVIAPLKAYQPPQRRSGTWRAPSSVAHTCLYTFPTVAGTQL